MFTSAACEYWDSERVCCVPAPTEKCIAFKMTSEWAKIGCSRNSSSCMRQLAASRRGTKPFLRDVLIVRFKQRFINKWDLFQPFWSKSLRFQSQQLLLGNLQICYTCIFICCSVCFVCKTVFFVNSCFLFWPGLLLKGHAPSCTKVTWFLWTRVWWIWNFFKSHKLVNQFSFLLPAQ